MTFTKYKQAIIFSVLLFLGVLIFPTSSGAQLSNTELRHNTRFSGIVIPDNWNPWWNGSMKRPEWARCRDFDQSQPCHELFSRYEPYEGGIYQFVNGGSFDATIRGAYHIYQPAYGENSCGSCGDNFQLVVGVLYGGGSPHSFDNLAGKKSFGTCYSSVVTNNSQLEEVTIHVGGNFGAVVLGFDVVGNLTPTEGCGGMSDYSAVWQVR